MLTLPELEAHFTPRLGLFMARDGAARPGGVCSNKKLCFVSTDKRYLASLLLELSKRADCYVVKYSITPHYGMHLGRAFMISDDIVGTLWAHYKAGENVYCTVQDDDFTERFRPV